MNALSIEIKEKSFPGGRANLRRSILRDVVLAVEEGQFLCILGPSGCGKTTLLDLLGVHDGDRESATRHAPRAGRPQARSVPAGSYASG
jgi:ABC-type nitrate/sulfonate/bicarbonate transport system ATPase subunit